MDESPRRSGRRPVAAPRVRAAAVAPGGAHPLRTTAGADERDPSSSYQLALWMLLAPRARGALWNSMILPLGAAIRMSGLPTPPKV